MDGGMELRLGFCAQQGVSLKILSLCPFSHSCACTCALSLSKINKSKKKKNLE